MSSHGLDIMDDATVERTQFIPVEGFIYWVLDATVQLKGEINPDDHPTLSSLSHEEPVIWKNKVSISTT